MKKLFILISFLTTLILSSQNKQNLYLVFDKKKDTMYISLNKDLNDLDIYSFVIQNYKKQKNILYFTSLTLEEEKEYFKLNGKYKVKIKKDTLCLKKLKNYNLKSHKWLKNKIKKNNNFYKISENYKDIFVVEIDSINKKAYLTKVQHTEIID